MGATPATSRARRAAQPRNRPRRRLLAASLLVVVGAFLPWVSTGAGNLAGIRGGGLWTMYAAFLGLAGALLPWRRVAALHAAVVAAAAVLVPLWQVAHLWSLVGTVGWLPGPGLVLTLGGGVLAATAAVALARAGGRPAR